MWVSKKRNKVEETEVCVVPFDPNWFVLYTEDGRRPGRFFFRKRGLNNFNVSFVPFDGDLWRDSVVLRDYLRTHPDEVGRYAAIKKAAAQTQTSPNSLLGYQNHKRPFVEEMKERARVWHNNSGQ